jgi:hypothetical protein
VFQTWCRFAVHNLLVGIRLGGSLVLFGLPRTHACLKKIVFNTNWLHWGTLGLLPCSQMRFKAKLAPKPIDPLANMILWLVVAALRFGPGGPPRFLGILF